ncbi:toxin VasX [Onishia niordana]|uniref:toxin VasX n=1 Tax=Onishia niordana TaxID=2508711 RepID=UPI001F10F5B6|nr:toxin VasX [Halomonas niordiana]
MSQELSQHKACEPPKLFIQVMGKQHPEGHRFVFYDLEDQQEQSAIAERLKEEDVADPVSHIHGWDWTDEPSRNVWLEIASEQGTPIQVPLFREVSETPWQEHPHQTTWQHHVVQPVMPMALWASLRDGESHALPVRSGYLYIHYRGAIWREIEVSITDQGQWEFRDVDLSRHRDGEGLYTDNCRESVGTPLSEVWLPARKDLAWFSSAVRVAFSEVQWSAPRLNYLEANDSERQRRFQSVSLSHPRDDVRSGRLLSASTLPVQRERCPGLERRIAHPPLWTEDLSGEVVSSRYAQAEAEQRQLAAGGSEAISGAWNKAKMSDSPLALEAGLRAAAMESICAEGRPTSENESDGGGSALKEAAPAGSDVLADARAREIPGLVLNDTLFDLSHALEQTQLAQHYLSLLLEHCAQQPHHRSAVMLQKRVMPQRIRGQENPYHDVADGEALNYRAGKFHTAVATLARDIAHELWESHQGRLAELIGDHETQLVLGDLFSLEGGDYLAGFYLSQLCFTCLSMDRQRSDTLWDGDIADQFGTPQTEKAAHTLQRLLEEGSSEPLHAMCFPDAEAHPVDAPFVLPENEINDGSGLFRALALSQEGERSEPPAPDELQAWWAALPAAMAANSSGTGELKRWANTLDGILGKIAESGKNLLSQVAEEGERTAMKARLYLPAFNASRSALPNLIGELTFQPLGEVDLGRKVILGVEDVASGLTFGLDKAEREYLASNHHRRFYGEVFRTENGEEILTGGTNRQRLRSMAELGEAREIRFIVVDADSNAAHMARQGRQRIGFAERAAEVTKLPYILVVVEAINLHQSLLAASKEGAVSKSGLYAFSALVDLGLAGLNISDYITKRHQAPQPIARVSEISQKVLKRNQGGGIIARLFPELITVNWLVAKGSALLLAITMTWEAFERFDEGDTDAGIAFATAATGATLLMVFGGPVGWIGLALLLGGGVSGILLMDGPMEQWLKHGPFGDQRDDAPWLQEPVEAYYRLQGVLANIQITARRVSVVERDALLSKIRRAETSSMNLMRGSVWQMQDSLQDINTAIEVRSALPGMGSELEDNVVLERVLGTRTSSPSGTIWERSATTRRHPILTRIGHYKISYFLHTPAPATERRHGFGSFASYRWDVRLQFREPARRPPLLPHIFPAPAPLDDGAVVLSDPDDYWIKETLDVR